MSEAIDVQFQKALQYAIADICNESRRKNLTLADTVELAIIRGMKWQKNLDEINKPEPKEDKGWMYAQRNCTELPGDYFERQGYHPPKEPPLDKDGYPYHGITKNISEDQVWILQRL